MPATQSQIAEALKKLLTESGGLDKVIDPIKEAQAAQIEESRQDCIREWGIDPADKQMDFTSPKFSGRKFLEGVQKALNISEAVSYSSLASFARHGLLSTIVNMYDRQEFEWKPLVTVVPSDTYSEFMSALYETDLPQRVGDTEEADESRLIGRNFEIVNHEYARILRVPKKIVNDDQTGQILRRAGGFGRGMALTEYQEVINMYILRSTWTNSAATDVTQPAIEQAWTALRKVKDPQGNYLVVMPNTILVDATRELRTKKLCDSLYQSAIPFADDGANPPNPAPPGSPGYFMTENVLRDMKFKVIGSPFINQDGSTFGTDGVSPRWYMMEAGEGAFLTDREPLAVTQEDPMSGKSWSTRTLAWQMTRRFGTGIVDDFAIYAGNG
jgi:hypothetical protein